MRLLICLLFLFPYQVFGQTPLSYQDIIAVNGVEKDQLYFMARRWFSDHFKKMDAVLDINDKETGEMTAKFKIAYHSSIKKGSDCSKGYINARLS